MRARKLVPHLSVLVAVAAMIAVAGSRPAHAGGKNQIRGVAIRHDAGATTVRIQGSGTPTFTVYKLERPTRVVVDVAQATLDRSVRGDEPSATFAVNSWAVSQVAAMAMEDGSTSVRVVVTLARPGRYDVKADGKDVVVKVSPRDPEPAVANSAELERARAEAAAARQAAAQEQKKAQDAVAAAAAARKAADDAMKAASTASSSERASAERKVAEAKAEAARAREAAEQAEANARAAAQRAEQSARAQIAKAKTDADAEIAKAKSEAEVEIAKARAAAERDREEAAQARAAADRTMADATAKLAKVEADRKRVEAEARAAERARDEAKAEAARAEQRERDARIAADKAAAERKAAQDAVARAEAERARAAGASTDAVRVRAAADEKIKDAEARLARAEAARVAAETARKQAERAATAAREDADRAAAAARKDAAAAQAAIAAATTARTQADAATREAMAQRAAAESQRAAAEQRKADTLAEADRAETRRAQAEAAAARAAEIRRAEEAAAASAADTRRTEEAAAARARTARQAEEQAMQAAAAARASAEARKQAAERAADQAERAVAMERDAAKVARDRKRAAEEAEAEARAAARRKASADEIATARAEASRLAAERERAERELAERTKEVTRTRAEADRLAAAKSTAAKEAERLAAERNAATAEVARLKQAAADARDARTREEARLAEVTKAREAEEQALARVRARPVPVPAPVPVPEKPAASVKAASTAPATIKPAKPTAKIAAVRFAPSDSEHTVVVDIDGKGATAELVRTGTRKAELVVKGATLPADLARTLDTSRFGGPIRAVSSYTDARTGEVRVVVDLTSEVTPRFDTAGGDLRLAFATPPAKVRTQSVPGPVVGGFGATSTPVTQTSVAQLGRKKVYRGPTIDLDFKDADIHDLLRTLADVGRVNIVVPEEVRASVTVRMKRVPWDQALDVILASKGLGYRKEGNLYRVAPQKQLDAEDEAEAARLRAMVEMEAPKPEVYTLNYTDAESVKPTLEPLLSPKGKIEVDKRTNSIVVNDVTRNRREIVDLARNLDTQTPQISIEARIVEARSQYERQIGIQWGGRALAGAAGGNATGLIFPSTVGFTGGAADPQKSENGVATPADFAVNLPVGGTQGALGLTLGSVGGNVNINLRLSALEETGTVRIISAPKVTVLNNIEAEMKQGVKIPISIVSAEGTQTQFVRAELSLKVTPYVSQRDCAIMMDVQVTKDEPDFVNTGARGDPTILNKEAKTRMLVNDGETSVMGGIYTRNSGLSYSKIPFFADIPVLGWLFKRRIETDDRAELLIFITPKITNKASLRCAP